MLEYYVRFGEVRFHDGKFWQWKGAFWEELNSDEIEKLIATDFGHYPCAKRQSDHRQIRVTLSRITLQSLRSEVVSSGLNFANGFLTEDLDLIPHHPDQGMTYVLHYCYTPEIAGQAPMFKQMLHDIWGRDPDFSEKVAALQEAMGAALFGRGTDFNRAVLFYGAAATGKSTTVEIMRELVPPESASAVSPEKWHERFSPVQMAGKLVNFAGELPESKAISGDMFKQIVGGEPILVERKNEQPFQVKLQAMHWFASNYLPRTRDISAGFSRRWLILEFKYPVPPAKRVLRLAETIVADEAEAIVAWAVQGHIRLRQQGDFTLPASHHTLLDRMNSGNSSLYHFLSTSPTIIVGPDATSAAIAAKDLYDDYAYFSLRERIRHRLEFRSFQTQMDQFAAQFGFESFIADGKPYYRYIELRKLGI